MKTTAAFVLAAANLVAGHTTFQSFVIDGKNQGQHFAVQTPSNGNNPIKDVTSPLMNCNGGTATADQIEVAAGSSIGMQWHHNDDGKDTFPTGDSDEPIAASHKGPVMVYIAPAESKGEGAVWTKIYEDGLSGGKWAVDTFIANKGLITVDLPNLKAGDYLIRPEMIGLHEGNNEGGAQFYNGCGQIKVTGSGSATLPSTGVDMTKAYSATDPGVLFNMYGGATTYEIPGPKVWDGASSGSAPAPSTPSETAATPVSSATPSKTATPVASASPVASPVEEAEPATSTPAEEAEPATPSPVESAAPAPTSGSGSGSALPETFTIEQFISWLKATTGTSARRARRAHARAFQL
ncbi:lytic polysaccharide monooxygenase [Plenodomus tracheiphilus IPT5]|uniref:AA9 family lytic polysaccharide monooxygenase n=1 Tax=Plenodomus tracheiphilus IPT5 TaxID=1408161 RepID=A0A6A7AUU8_9PLEO|nr:lytic polysaccharide monooxygenase [Plenodomus tracheiphilus IPT5]